MTFGELHSGFNNLRRQLSVHVSPNTLGEITVEPPRGDSDELSFFRLVAWGYVLLNENGRVPLRFLKNLPPWQTAGALLPHVSALRTWMSHNLAFDSSHDLKIMRLASEWLSRACDTGSPRSDDQWKRCFDALAKELTDLIAVATKACDNFNDPTDGKRLVQELKERLDRDWPAYRFDAYVERAIQIFGYEGLDATSVRNGRVDQWRKVLAATHEDAIERILTQRIQAEVLEFMRNALPVPADEIAQLLRFDKSSLTAALLALRECGPAASRDVIASLRALADNSSEATAKA